MPWQYVYIKILLNNDMTLFYSNSETLQMLVSMLISPSIASRLSPKEFTLKLCHLGERKKNIPF